MTTPSDIIESSSQLSTHTTPVFMPLTASPSLRRSSASKLDALYEVSYLSDDGKVILSDLPLINPYQAFSKPQSLFTRSIKTLIKQNPKTVKEYVQSTKFDQCNLPATEQEQKGLPVCARITLLDTRMRKFQHASIGTLEATLNAGTVIVTFYPNFCMSLRDKRLLDALKVQLQIVGIDQDPDSLGSTLHYQMAYRVQNHAIDISIPGSSDALMLTVDTNHVPTCIHIPRHITTEELQQILPTSWITNYEKTQKPLPSVRSADPVFKSKKDGSIEISFAKNETTPRVFSTQYMMSTIIPEAAEISSFDKNGSPIYAFKSTSGHIYWDICNCSDCTTSNEQEEAPKKEKRRKEVLVEEEEDDDDDEEDGKKCCEGLTCEGWLSAVGTGYCKPYSNCQSQLGGECYSGYTKLHGCCYPNHCSAPREGGPATGVCLAPNSNDINNNVADEISNDHEDHHHLPTATY
ncbi:hypothetical protein G4B88_004613 [Cannabis sativa]|uniref:Uncharacterized protein n=1 Tax=Cannabis sativa TaxID=3483 RepID=A0A7J6FNT6_CANSA|nr:hypothetical protein G4B88_007041 [Cannabis sativa]KAF4378006.1 hypothetical protein G4B88_004613 [Cannabis sativa]